MDGCLVRAAQADRVGGRTRVVVALGRGRSATAGANADRPGRRPRGSCVRRRPVGLDAPRLVPVVHPNVESKQLLLQMVRLGPLATRAEIVALLEQLEDAGQVGVRSVVASVSLGCYGAVVLSGWRRAGRARMQGQRPTRGGGKARRGAIGGRGATPGTAVLLAGSALLLVMRKRRPGSTKARPTTARPAKGTWRNPTGLLRDRGGAGVYGRHWCALPCLRPRLSCKLLEARAVEVSALATKQERKLRVAPLSLAHGGLHVSVGLRHILGQLLHNAPIVHRTRPGNTSGFGGASNNSRPAPLRDASKGVVGRQLWVVEAGRRRSPPPRPLVVRVHHAHARRRPSAAPAAAAMGKAGSLVDGWAGPCKLSEATRKRVLLRYDDTHFGLAAAARAAIGRPSDAALSPPLHRALVQAQPRRDASGSTSETPIQPPVSSREWRLGDGWRQLSRAYDALIQQWVLPQFGCDLLVQSEPVLRLVLPGSVAPCNPHCDADYYHDASELNYWLPLTHAFGACSLWVESEPGRSDFVPLEGGAGHAFRFYGNRCRHFTVSNTSEHARLSLDFRVLPAHLAHRDGATEQLRTRVKLDGAGGYYRLFKWGLGVNLPSAWIDVDSLSEGALRGCKLCGCERGLGCYARRQWRKLDPTCFECQQRLELLDDERGVAGVAIGAAERHRPRCRGPAGPAGSIS